MAKTKFPINSRVTLANGTSIVCGVVTANYYEGSGFLPRGQILVKWDDVLYTDGSRIVGGTYNPKELKLVV